MKNLFNEIVKSRNIKVAELKEWKSMFASSDKDVNEKIATLKKSQALLQYVKQQKEEQAAQK